MLTVLAEHIEAQPTQARGPDGPIAFHTSWQLAARNPAAMGKPEAVDPSLLRCYAGPAVG